MIHLKKLLNVKNTKKREWKRSMTNKKKKIKTLTILFFIMGLVLYLSGLLLLFIASIYFNLNFLKIIGASLFLIGFIMFMVAIIILYKDNEIKENNLNLIIEGKADVLTIIFMTYIMIFMLVLCLIFDEIIGALLFGITIIIQSALNTILIKYYSKRR